MKRATLSSANRPIGSAPARPNRPFKIVFYSKFAVTGGLGHEG